MLIAHKEILIVEDEPAFRTIFNRKLRAAGYQTVLAQNGEEALIALWEKESIGLVLLDVRLPFINGLNISEIIRKHFPDKKIIVSSALQKDEQQFLIKEADDYYYKGDDLDSLTEKIEKVLNNKSMAGMLAENEKRNHKRIPVNVLASCESVRHGLTTASEHFFSYTKDLSLQGGRFVVGEDIKRGQHFTAALELPVNFLPLLIDCEVVWVKGLEAGVRFIKPDLPHDEDKLKEYFNYV